MPTATEQYKRLHCYVCLSLDPRKLLGVFADSHAYACEIYAEVHGVDPLSIRYIKTLVRVRRVSSPTTPKVKHRRVESHDGVFEEINR